MNASHSSSVTDVIPADVPGGDSPMAVRSAGLLPATPALSIRRSPDEGEIDVWSLAARLARGHERVVMRATVAEIRALAAAVLDLTAGLVSAHCVDRTASYAPGEARPDGAVPAAGERWRTPREVVEQFVELPAAPSSFDEGSGRGDLK